MHVYIMTRGQKAKVDEFIRDLEAQYFPYKHSPHEPQGFLQLGVRPIQLWEIAFPKEHVNEVLTTLDGSEFTMKDKRFIPKILSLALKVKSLFGLKPMPKYDKSKRRIVHKCDIDVKFIGIKQDKQDGSIELV